MNRYETLFVLHPEVPEQARREAVERMQRLIESMAGTDVVVDEWGMRDLAYLIQKQSRGVYVRLEYTAAPEVVKELERTMKLADDVLRFVSVRVPKAAKEPPRVASRSSSTSEDAAPAAE